MSFWDGVKKVGNAAYKTMQENMEQIERYKEQYDSLDDEQLIKRYKSSSGDQKMACAMLLKERGYGSNNK